MKSGDKTQSALSRITVLRAQEPCASVREELTKLLGHGSNHVVGAAAEVLKDWNASDAVPEMELAFHRFMKTPTDSDPGCAAKRPLLEALTRSGCTNAELFLAASRHIQMEAVWGKPVDTAPGVRGLAGRGLVTMHHPGAILVLADLLLDPEIETRRITVDTLVELGSNEAELLLRVGAQLDPVPGAEENAPEESIVAECLSGLMRLQPDRSIEFVARFLQRGDDEQLSVALAIGESRHPDAFTLLRNCWDRTNNQRERLLLPIALIRSNDAFSFLGEVLQEEDEWKEAVDALALFASDSERAAQIHARAALTEDQRITEYTKRMLEEA